MVLHRVLAGSTPSEIAQEICRSVNTVRTHLKSLYVKTGVRRQADLIRLLLPNQPRAQRPGEGLE